MSRKTPVRIDGPFRSSPARLAADRLYVRARPVARPVRLVSCSADTRPAPAVSPKRKATSLCGQPPADTLAQVSRRPMVRLNTGRPGV